mmetsp:Transcript_67653/g.109733  ORF Transcript_67653/g.109733 Transcript_67653/m.109733 type:complete len:314 (-) Transcript_67653:903-1844(-)
MCSVLINMQLGFFYSSRLVSYQPLRLLSFGMVRPEDSQQCRRSLHKHVLCLSLPVHLFENYTHVVFGIGHVRVVVARHPNVDLEAHAELGERLVELALQQVHLPDIIVRCCHVRVVTPLRPDHDIKALVVLGERLFVPALQPVHLPNIIVRCAHVRVVAAQHSRADLEGFLVVLERLVVLALAPQHPALPVEYERIRGLRERGCRRGERPAQRPRPMEHVKCAGIVACFMQELCQHHQIVGSCRSGRHGRQGRGRDSSDEKLLRLQDLPLTRNIILTAPLEDFQRHTQVGDTRRRFLVCQLLRALTKRLSLRL